MKAFILTALLVTFLEFGYSQNISKEVVASAGETYTHTTENFTMSWTLGETVIGTLTSGDGSITISQGFHSGGPLSGIGIDEYMHNEGMLFLYPNPVDKTLFMYVSRIGKAEFSYKIFNSQGQVIAIDKVSKIDELIEIDVSGNKPGIYFLISEFKNGERNSYKFIKN
ncbi:MAG TPA: T9SS type A sorting domain-containing protein [Salinivirga sp.]|uniref:T9SS type A sorting domain-containing protein n=1 Tax=Salinivirga sp. TaxID=1970192 RepID=UPI002B487F3E|nr:T9SS type A sorting domain-containing protein [Salinivirga sp.]HKK59134.1 T9SS type A sorting domain-containing protein [Salinivirga sp.]